MLFVQAVTDEGTPCDACPAGSTLWWIVASPCGQTALTVRLCEPCLRHLTGLLVRRLGG